MIITPFFKKKGFCMYLLYAYTFEARKNGSLPRIMNGIICVDAFHDAELEYIILRVNASLMKDFEDYNFKFVYKELLNIIH